MLLPLQASNRNPKQITIGNSTLSAVVYTVPAGRKFLGRIFNTILSSTQINGASFNFFAGSVNSGTTNIANSSTFMDLTLLAGTVVSNPSSSAGSCQILGIEVDA